MKKLLFIALMSGLGFASCQKESLSDQGDHNEITIDGKSYKISHLKNLAVSWFQRDISEIGYDKELKAFYIEGYDNRWSLEDILPTLLHFEQK
ncbi:hypothetical protein [Sphingobacterium chungjuense]|uniref:hypothetical protein n=1 Tax=Sphingobacterium chungjuense TaxID=2675553 RepID=UPI00140E0217|nr:hypothetical protein [Sphingobacterium chungjuense]